WAHVLVALPVRVKRHLAAYRVKLPLQIVDAPTIEGERHNSVLPIELGDLVRDRLRIGRRSDRCNQAEFLPCTVGGVVLFAAFLQIARKPTIRLYMKHAGAILPDDH